MNNKMPNGWIEIPQDEMHKFALELKNEICSYLHPLYNKNVTALFRGKRHDDVLFKVENDQFGYCFVHLTWAKGLDPTWPYIIRFKSIDDFCANYEKARHEYTKNDLDENWRYYNKGSA